MAILNRYSTHLGLLGMAALWGASWPWGRVVTLAMPPIAAAGFRFVLASLVLGIWLRHSGKAGALRGLTARQWWGLVSASAFGVLGYAVFFMLALQKVPASKAAVVVALNPVVTLLLAAVLFREKLNWKIGLGVVMAVIGALYTLSGGRLSALLPDQAGTGEMLLLGCVVCWVGYTLIGRSVLTSIDSLATTTITSVLGAAFLLLTSLVVEGTSAWSALAQAPAQAWYCLVALAVGGTALAYAWYLKGIKVLGAGAASAYIALVPFFGVLFSSLWLKEAITLPVLAGGILAIAGMAIMNFGRLSPSKR